MKSPKWADEQRHERSDSRAARVAALYLMRDQLPDIPKVQLAAALGISRWTLDRDLSSMTEVEQNVQKIQTIIKERGTMTVTVHIHENAGDIEDWLTDPDTGDFNEADVDAYEATLQERMMDYLSDEGVTEVDVIMRPSEQHRLTINGDLDFDEEMRLEKIVQDAYEVIMNQMGNDWESWCPSSQAAAQ